MDYNQSVISPPSEKVLGEKGETFCNGKEGRDDFRKSLILKNKIYARYSNHYYGWRRRQPLLAYVNPRLPKAVHRCDGCRPFPHSIDSR